MSMSTSGWASLSAFSTKLLVLVFRDNPGKSPQTFFLGHYKSIDWQKNVLGRIAKKGKKISQISVTMFQTEMNTKAIYSRKETGKKLPVSCKAL